VVVLGLITTVSVLLGPETRGRDFDASATEPAQAAAPDPRDPLHAAH
jgi:hypothetical protein